MTIIRRAEGVYNTCFFGFRRVVRLIDQTTACRLDYIAVQEVLAFIITAICCMNRYIEHILGLEK